MSYNISTWKTKKLDEFRVPLAALVVFTEDQRQRGWGARVLVPDGATLDAAIAAGAALEGVAVHRPTCVVVEIMESRIVGHLEGAVLAVENIDISGEGSGSTWMDHLSAAFRQSTGTLEAVLIWEGGDSVSRVTVYDGVLMEEDVEL